MERVRRDASFGMEPHYFSYSLTIRLWTRGGDSETEEEPLSGSSLGGSPLREASRCVSLRSH